MTGRRTPLQNPHSYYLFDKETKEEITKLGSLAAEPTSATKELLNGLLNMILTVLISPWVIFLL